VTFDFTAGAPQVSHDETVAEPWKVSMVNTGVDTQTGGRVRRIRPWVGDGTFMLTYGDGVGRIDIDALLAFHRAHGRLATVTATQPAGRFGSLELGGADRVTSFQEKPQGDGTWINAGYFVFEPGIFDFLGGDDMALEQEPLDTLARRGELVAYRHRGFWQPMDTLRDKNLLEKLWQSGAAPWKVWG
jgi:glucose-1-phosphate cytidylyltransferase